LKYASGGRCRWLGRAARARCRCRAPARAGAAPPPWAGLPHALGPLPLLPPLPRARALSLAPAASHARLRCWACTASALPRWASPACLAASDRVGRE